MSKFALAVIVGVIASMVSIEGREARPDAAAYKREVPARLLARTKVTEDSARAIAIARVPDGRVRALELEDEHGHLIWSFEIKVKGRSGIEEVNVSALDGTVVSMEHENPTASRQDTTRVKLAAPVKPPGSGR